MLCIIFQKTFFSLFSPLLSCSLTHKDVSSPVTVLSFSAQVRTESVINQYLRALIFFHITFKRCFFFVLSNFLFNLDTIFFDKCKVFPEVDDDLLVLRDDQGDKQDDKEEGDDHEKHVGCRVTSHSCKTTAQLSEGLKDMLRFTSET